MEAWLRRLQVKMAQQVLQRIAAMEALKASGTSNYNDMWEWRGVGIGLGALWRNLVCRAIQLMIGPQ